MEANLFKCNMCAYTTDVFASFKKHFVRSHKNDPQFYVACCIDSCAYTTNKWANYRVHVHRKHQHVDQLDMPIEYGEQSDVDVANSEPELTEDVDAMHFNAMFSLCLEAKHNMSQPSIDNVVSAANDLLESHLSFFEQALKDKLVNIGVNPAIMDDIETSTFLECFDTRARRESFYKKNLDTLVNPEAVTLGQKHVTINGSIEEIPKVGYIVPFQESVKCLLQLPEVWRHVQFPHTSNNEFMYDICDGDAVKHHPLFSNDSKALQIILNCDDMEIVNPLGSHVKKHKVTMFYYTLGNIPPEHRSKLQAIQLLAICKAKDVRCANSIDTLLADFITTVNELSQDGIEMELHGSTHVMKGNLVIVAADTLASNWLGKFKEGVSFALKNCRRCEIENTDVKDVCCESEVTLRTLESHRAGCNDLDLTVTADARNYSSKLWGINGSSCLLKIHDFDMLSGLVQDPMHVLLEGVLPYELSQILYRCIYVDSYFSLKWLNTAIGGFRYSYLDKKAKPETIDKKHIDGTGTLKQTAAAMITLFRTLPIIIGRKIPNENPYWKNTLRLMQIVLFSTSSYCSKDTILYLRLLIAEYLYTFRSLYPKTSVIPKMHYMVHLPTQMAMYGPLRNHWCMRFEGKNGYFANKKYKNFKNLPLTLAKRHQLYMAYMQTGHEGGRSNTFLYAGDKVGNGSESSFSETYPDLVESLKELTKSDIDMVYVTKSVSIHGSEYQVGCAIVVEYIENEPIFGLVVDIVIIDHRKYFVLEQCEAEFNFHILCYTITSTGRKKIMPYDGLQFKWSLSVYKYQGACVVMNVNSHTYPCPF